MVPASVLRVRRSRRSCPIRVEAFVRWILFFEARAVLIFVFRHCPVIDASLIVTAITLIAAYEVVASGVVKEIPVD
jgi:hypothetical protein